MRCLTYSETAQWCNAHEYPLVHNDLGLPVPALERAFNFVEIPYPTDSGQKVALARRAMMRQTPNEDLLVWLGGWSVWPSSGHLPLFARFRQAIGETRLLIEAPGHLVAPEDREDGLSIVAMALLFVWDCHVFSASGSIVFVSSHDEWAGLFVAKSTHPEAVPNLGCPPDRG